MKCQKCGFNGDPAADGVSIRGMFDCHLFHRITGATVDDVIFNWLEYNATPNMAQKENGDEVSIGDSALCPAIVLCGKDELRRVGKMVHRITDWEAIRAYRKALQDDPDIPRLLANSQAPAPQVEQEQS